LGWLGTRKFPVLLAAATLLPIAALCALSLRTLAQDRDLERQRLRERLEVAAGRVALEIERRLGAIETPLAEGDGVRLLPGGLATEGTPILYQPGASPPLQLLSSELLAVAQQEFQQNDVESAIAAYRRIASLPSAAARGDALVALGALLRRTGRFEEALRVYTDLEQLGMSHVAGGQPAALVARQGRGKALEQMGDEVRLRAEAAALADSLYRGSWPIDQTTFDLYRDMIERWGGGSPDVASIQRTDASIQLWHAWRRGELAPRGRRLLIVDDMSVFASWVTGDDGPIAALLTTDQLQDMWRSTRDAQDVDVAILGVDGRTILGTRREGAVALSPADTRLPFVLTVSWTGGTDGAEGHGRRAVMIGGLLLAFGLMVTASYGLYRVTTRELLLARQQSDFVAAVSHEFRTPLTSMRHLTELLATRSITSEERKSHYYGLLAHETERLHRMVESLLSFGRIDAGAHAWRREAVEVTALVSSVVDEFGRDARGRAVRVDIEERVPAIDADGEALSRALWNLLENAAKYSEPDAEIRIFARRSGDSVLLGVQDNGIGIPASEQTRVFQKFVRGDQARRAGVRGVGIGLALVKRIVEAHGGAVRLESEVGRGSTFTLVIPCRVS
jgi:signal transduction histidine kinase